MGKSVIIPEYQQLSGGSVSKTRVSNVLGKTPSTPYHPTSRRSAAGRIGGRAAHARGTARKWSAAEAVSHASAGGVASAAARVRRRLAWLAEGAGL